MGRNKLGTLVVKSDNVGRSLAADRRKRAKTKVQPGQGNQGDRARPKTKRWATKKSAQKRGPGRPSARQQRMVASSLPEFVPFALCQLVDRPPTGVEWVHEVKLDGWRLQVRVEDGEAVIRTRNGLNYTKTFPWLAKAARGFDNCILDGEICAVDRDGLTNFAALQTAMKAGQTLTFRRTNS